MQANRPYSRACPLNTPKHTIKLSLYASKLCQTSKSDDDDRFVLLIILFMMRRHIEANRGILGLELATN